MIFISICEVYKVIKKSVRTKSRCFLVVVSVKVVPFMSLVIESFYVHANEINVFCLILKIM